MISDVEETSALMIPEEEHFNETDNSYHKDAPPLQTAQENF